MSKYILVTGAYGGMGRAVVDCFKAQGYTVFALDRVVEKAEENVIPLQADITDERSLQRAFAVVQSHTERVDVIVHFAGIYSLDSLIEMEKTAFERAFAINLFGAAGVHRIFLPLLKKGSKILHITSELAPLAPLPFTGIYAITKGALDRYAYSLRMELQLLGIDVSVLRAGAVQTPMLGVSTDALEAFCQKTKLYRCNAARFKKIVERVEARCIPPQRLAKKVSKILAKKHPKFAYSINRNPLLLLLNLLPSRLQFFIIREILK